MYRDINGHFTSKENDGGECPHNVKREYRQNTPYEEILSKEDERKEFKEDISLLLGKEYKGYKGQKAIEKLLQEKQGHIKGAFYREDIGNIDLIWGNDSLGLKHIIERRTLQGIPTDQFFEGISNVIELGTFRKKNDRGNFEFMLNNKIAVISPELKGNKLTFLLTAFKTHSKK